MAFPSARRRRDQARIAALSRIPSGSPAAAMGAGWSPIGQKTRCTAE
uniref:Uncharacterized protein n=1 Tax=Arundo donax TaxID=35708 RepID=A0A0A9C9W0_ARUDO